MLVVQYLAQSTVYLKSCAKHKIKTDLSSLVTSYYFDPSRDANYCDQRVCTYVCLSVRLSVRLHISKTTRNILYISPVAVVRSSSDIVSITPIILLSNFLPSIFYIFTYFVTYHIRFNCMTFYYKTLD